MRWVALLRGINVGARTRIPMAELRALCTALGWDEVRTYIQSGNVVFESEAGAAKLEAALESAVERKFGLAISILVRSAAEWPALAAANPFPAESEREGNRVMMCLAKAPIASDAAETLQARAAAGERVRQSGEALWVHYPEGAGISKLSPALFDRLAGSPGTARNVRTVAMLGEWLAE